MAATTAVVNTASGWTNIQWTTTAGGNTVVWYSAQLQAATLTGIVWVYVWAAESNAAANGTIQAEVAVVNNDGSGATVYGASCYGGELSTTAQTVPIMVAGNATVISAGQRIRLKLNLDDYEGPLVTGHTATVSYSTATGVTADTRIQFPITLTEQAGSTFAPPRAMRNDRRIVPLL